MTRPARARVGEGPFGLEVGFVWLQRLRLGAAAAEALVVVLARYALRIELPLSPMLGLVGITLATAVAFAPRTHPGGGTARLAGGLLVLDVLTLTGLLLLSGGASNPFTALYFVYVTLASVVLGGGWAWAVQALSVACFGALFVGSRPVAALGGHHHHHAVGGGSAGFSAHLYGMFVAFAVASGLIAFFVTRLAGALRERERELAKVRERAAASEKLAALTTLAAGAAHELGTPLGTIAVVANELERRLRGRDDLGDAVDDAHLIRTEVVRCRTILDSMAARTGEEVGELPARVSGAALAASLRERVGGGADRLDLVDPPQALVVPPGPFVQMLANVVRNALQASEGHVEVRFTAGEGFVGIEVSDEGPGMDPEVRARATEPFFTTKEVGEGLGLGLFLSLSVAERLGGSLTIDSEPGGGTTVRIVLPVIP